MRPFFFALLTPLCVLAANFTTGNQTARKFGVHEVEFSASHETQCSVRFVRPDGSSVQVNAFHEGSSTWRARAYVDATGSWKWQASCSEAHGAFNAAASKLRGMLRIHRDNPRQWMTDDGRWFLNINDTAYMLFKPSESNWREYIEDDVKLGVTSVRAGALGTIVWNDAHTRGVDLDQFRVTDERLRWMLNNHPDLYVQLILFGLKTWGKDDTGLAWKAIPQRNREQVMREMIARWAAFPQIFWLSINDMHFDSTFPNNRAFVQEVGRFFAANDPWHHLLSAGPKREMGFPLHRADEPWLSYIHIEDVYELDAEEIRAYKDVNLHVFLGEDRYEQDRFTRDPKHPRYYFRRLFWSWLLAGGSASYGGRWRVIQPYSQTGSLSYATGWGQQDEHTYTERLHGLDDVRHLRAYYAKRGIDLSRFTPENGIPLVTRRAEAEILVYHANGIGSGREANVDESATAEIKLSLPARRYRVEWFDPATGRSTRGAAVRGGQQTFTAPWRGTDVVLRLVAE